MTTPDTQKALEALIGEALAFASNDQTWRPSREDVAEWSQRFAALSQDRESKAAASAGERAAFDSWWKAATNESLGANWQWAAWQARAALRGYQPTEGEPLPPNASALLEELALELRSEARPITAERVEAIARHLAAPPPPMGGEPVALNKFVIEDKLTRQAQQRTSLENIEDVLAAIRARYGKLYTSPMGGAAEGWRPIETAPKVHGQSVLLISMTAPAPEADIGHWSDEERQFCAGHVDDWQRAAANGLWVYLDKPTHWMPLPPRHQGPAMSQEKEAGAALRNDEANAPALRVCARLYTQGRYRRASVKDGPGGRLVLKDDAMHLASYWRTIAFLRWQMLENVIAERDDALAALSQKTAMKTERVFDNELNNRIRITIEGPNSTSENVLTPREVAELREGLNAPYAWQMGRNDCRACGARVAGGDACLTACSTSAKDPRMNADTQSKAAASAGEGVAVAWRDMASAPLDGTLVRLLVKFDNNGIEETEEPTATIGHCCDGEWHFVGWDWHRDEWARGSGDLLGWLPMLAAPVQPAPMEALSGYQPTEGVAGVRGYMGSTPDGGIDDHDEPTDALGAQLVGLKRVQLGGGAIPNWCLLLEFDCFESAAKAEKTLAAPPPPMGGEPVARVNADGFIVETGLPLAPGTKLYTSPMGGAAEGWRPIETAPKDGSKVLLWWEGRALIGYWDTRLKDYELCYPRKAWMAGMDTPDQWTAPTHWQPLAAAPQEGSANHG